MLSRVAQGLYALGRCVEAAQNVVRILEVNHKMNLERAAVDESNVWTAISESFGCGLDHPDEAGLYAELVLSFEHPYSVRRCIGRARDQARAMRDHISEEIWLHQNRTHLELADLDFGEVLRLGRSEFNRQIEDFGDALFGLADDTLIRGESWAFLWIGRHIERATMICRILEIKRKSLALSPEAEGDPVDVHQWQALLRSLSGYEPYRRAYDARIVPEQVLDFVLKRRDFPRSLSCALGELHGALEHVSHGHAAQLEVTRAVGRLLEQLRFLDPPELTRSGSFEGEIRRLDHCCRAIGEGLELGYFTSYRPATAPVAAAPGAFLVPQ